MRGALDLVNTGLSYYLVGRSKGAYYVYQDTPPVPAPPAPDPNADVHAVFASTKYVPGTTSFQPRLVAIRKDAASAGVYTLRAPLSPGASPTNMILTTLDSRPNVLDLATTPVEGVGIRFAPSSNVGTQTLWSGVWYRAQAVDGAAYLWKQMPTRDATGTFRGIGGVRAVPTDADFEVMFIPRDAGSDRPIGVWVDGRCRTPQGADAALRLFMGWVDNEDGNAPENCDGPAWLVDGQFTSNRCAFTSVDTCQEKYLYTICPAGATCGECLGPCTPVTGPPPYVPLCQHDFSVTSGKSPLSCNPVSPAEPTFWDRYKAWIIVAIVIGLIVIILAIVFISTIFRHRHAKVTPEVYLTLPKDLTALPPAQTTTI